MKNIKTSPILHRENTVVSKKRLSQKKNERFENRLNKNCFHHLPE